MNPVMSRMNTYVRHFMIYNLANRIPLYIITEYPKSGGSWVGQMLEKALEVPFPRNRFPVFGKSIMHGHYLNPGKMKNVVVVWRDGRDVLVSWYYHCLFVHEYGNERIVRRTRRELAFESYENIRANLPRFIEYAFTRQPNPHFSWTDFVGKWAGRRDVIHVRYEDIHSDTAGELRRIILELGGRSVSPKTAEQIAREFSFARQSREGRSRGKSFLRKGIVGDWRNHFSAEARIAFDRYAGDALIRLGYEKDHRWMTDETAYREQDRLS
ncbi:hypothetical protein DENIS_3177 [Desulfonema ishimotonii]|uniref:Sulfotransferase domain-containing protein n=1 Tax=Desulfonema ishimotonii TaxID=45657 RepID=A0A401FZ11_9BACT|nr:sulfotransferase domain-containing protein [Desulfonema ishimotonii]GBC62208.1 hypothetical protein DENIS_3177 [Desulfonema ishimotonii]